MKHSNTQVENTELHGEVVSASALLRDRKSAQRRALFTDIWEKAEQVGRGATFRLKNLLRENESVVIYRRGGIPVAVRAEFARENERTTVELVPRFSLKKLRAQLATCLFVGASVSEASAMVPATVPRSDVVGPSPGAEATPTPRSATPKAPVSTESTASNDSAPCSETSPPKEVVADRLFPQPGQVALTASSGIPHALLGEVAVGVSPWFSLGLGATVSAKWNETSIFLRPRIALVAGEHLALAFHMPMAYYPASERRDGWDWFLTNPALFLRGHFTESSSVYFGAGAVVASTRQGLHEFFGGEVKEVAPEDWDFSNVGEGGVPEVNGAWNTVHLGFDQALGSHWVLHVDSLLLLSGISLSQSYADRVGPPVFIQAGGSFLF